MQAFSLHFYLFLREIALEMLNNIQKLLQVLHLYV